jgi:capsular polysaccharide biosynthesis protein
MLFSEFIALLLRQKLVILVSLSAVVIAAVTAVFFAPVKIETSQLYAISIRETETTNAYDLTKVADDFGQTLAGWAKTPTIADEIKKTTNSSVGIAGNTQTKQNFLLTITHTEPKKSAELANAATIALTKLIERYNAQSKYKFAITLAGTTTGTNAKSKPLIIAVATIAGLTLGIGWVLLTALLGGRVTTVTEAEELLGTKTTVRFCRLKSKNLHFLDLLLKKNSKRHLLVGVDLDLTHLAEKLESKPTIARIPEDISKLEGAPIFVVRLDTTKISTLQALRATQSGEIQLVIWG